LWKVHKKEFYGTWILQEPAIPKERGRRHFFSQTNAKRRRFTEVAQWTVVHLGLVSRKDGLGAGFTVKRMRVPSVLGLGWLSSQSLYEQNVNASFLLTRCGS
jgi:hypothetical protein